MGRKLLIYLLHYLFIIGYTQLLQRNQWRVISYPQHSQEGTKNNPFHASSLAGIASFQRQGNTVSMILVEQNYRQCYQLFGIATKTTININFHTLNPEYFGKVYGFYKIKIKRNKDSNFKTKIAFVRYWPNRKIAIAIGQYHITASAKQYSLSYAVIISICLAGIKILLLAVLLRRKRWVQMSEKFLFVTAGWHFKFVCLLWHQYILTEEMLSTSFFLLVVLTIKSLKIVIECSRIINKIIRNMKITVFSMICLMITLFISPLWLLHVLLPCMFKLQFKNYNQYSKMDSQVHYCFINFNLILSFQLVYLLYSFGPLKFQEILLLIYTILSFAAFFILGEHYQYSQSNNKSPLCVNTTFENKSICPFCDEELYHYENRMIPESESQFAFEKWRFCVRQCGHIFHQKCFQKMKSLKQNCPLLIQQMKNIKEDKVE